tara:strand:+ start:5347 stop:6033 length:687 start_codon:yes stop_codon:yes gene_type:complete
MKKSNLRKLIKESIKLLTEETNSKEGGGLTTIPPSDLPAKERTLPEQTGCAPNRAHIVSMACSGSLHWTGNWIPGPWHCMCCKLDGQAPTQAAVGQTMSHSGGSFGPNDFTITAVNPGVSGWNGNMITTPSCPTTGCTNADFQYTSGCGATHFVPAPGGANSWNNWLSLRWNGYNSIGCQHLQNVINWTTQQLASGVNAAGVPWTQTQIDRKNAKSSWAACMQTQCSC